MTEWEGWYSRGKRHLSLFDQSCKDFENFVLQFCADVSLEHLKRSFFFNAKTICIIIIIYENQEMGIVHGHIS